VCEIVVRGFEGRIKAKFGHGNQTIWCRDRCDWSEWDELPWWIGLLQQLNDRRIEFRYKWVESWVGSHRSDDGSQVEPEPLAAGEINQTLDIEKNPHRLNIRTGDKLGNGSVNQPFVHGLGVGSHEREEVEQAGHLKNLDTRSKFALKMNRNSISVVNFRQFAER
jgi:hypothetical protein